MEDFCSTFLRAANNDEDCPGVSLQELTLVAKKFMERTVTAQEVLQNVTDNFAGSFFTAGHSPDPLVQLQRRNQHADQKFRVGVAKMRVNPTTRPNPETCT